VARCCECGDEPEAKRPFGRPRRRWENNIVTDSQVLFHNGSLLHSGSIHNSWLQFTTLLEI
jgi:hypothetical protein